jgi:hypothetical protein
MKEKVVKPFEFFNCITLISPTGQKASNLKEFLNIIEESESKVIFHHLYQSPFKHEFKAIEYPNDFAQWAATSLEDMALAEKFANFDPYDFNHISEAKIAVIEIVEEHMWDLVTIPWVRPGFEFYFSSSTTIIFKLNMHADNLTGFYNCMKKAPLGSIYYHFYESRKRNKNKAKDDFSTWLREELDENEIADEINEIDFYFYSLIEAKERILSILKQKIK